LVVIEHEMAAHGAYLRGIFHAKSPTRHIHLVYALIAQVAVAVVPEPMPVIVKAVAREGMLGRRTLPKVVVHAIRHRFDGLAADCTGAFETQSTGHVDVADQAIAHLPDSFPSDSRSLLRPVLDHAVVLLRRRHHLPGLEHIVSARLFDVHVLAGLTCPD